MGRAHCLNTSRPTFSCSCIKCRSAHGQHLNGVRRLHSSNYVACIDRTLKGIGANHSADIRDGLNIHQGCCPGHNVFSCGGRCRQNMAVTGTQLSNQRSDVFRQCIGIGTIISNQYFCYTCNLGCLSSCILTGLTGHQNIYITTNSLSGSNRI